MSNISTDAVRAGIESDKQYGAITPPLYLTTNYSFEGFNQKREFDYCRSGNPTRQTLEQALSKLEDGAGATITSSGMAAVSLPLQLVKPGDLVIVPHDCYGGSFRLFSTLAEKGHFELLFVDQTDELQLKAALQRKPKLLWIETPSNPLLRIVDVKKLAAEAHKSDCLVVVDNTFLSPAFQKPLTLGADVVVHSTTKYINGHSDVVGGAVISHNLKIAEELAWWANCLGITGAPFDSFLTLRGLRTLPVRIKQHQQNTNTIVEFLEQSALVSKVYYPGLKSHPGHEIASQQQSGYGGIVSFELAGELSEVAGFLENLNIFSLAESLGGVESLVCHPATMTHAAMTEQARATAGITQSLIRLSVGIEDENDLLEDLQQSFTLVETNRQNKRLKVVG